MTDEAAAAREAARSALRGAGRPALGLAFCTDAYAPDRLAGALREELGLVPWAGCCGAGVIAGEALLSQGVAVGVIDSGEVRVGVGAAGPVGRDPRGSGLRAVRAALEGLPPAGPAGKRLILLFSDGLTGNTTEVVRGAAEEGGAGVAWAGGGAGDNFRFTRTAQFASGRALADHAVAVALDQPGPLGIGVRHGWEPFGPAMMVTQARGTRVRELDYAPAFEVYRATAAARGERFSRDEFTSYAMFHPLGIPQPFGPHLVRDPLTVGAEGGLDCVGEVPSGSLVQVMVGRAEGLLEAARGAALEARAALARPPEGALLFDCFSRLPIYQGRLEGELRAVQQGLGEGTPLLGCLTLGEVAAAGGGFPQFHNKTVVVVAL